VIIQITGSPALPHLRLPVGCGRRVRQSRYPAGARWGGWSSHPQAKRIPTRTFVGAAVSAVRLLFLSIGERKALVCVTARFVRPGSLRIPSTGETDSDRREITGSDAISPDDPKPFLSFVARLQGPGHEQNSDALPSRGPNVRCIRRDTRSMGDPTNYTSWHRVNKAEGHRGVY